MNTGTQVSNNALNQLAVREVSRRLDAIGLDCAATGRSSANPVPGHLAVGAADGTTYFIFVRVARLKTQVDRSQKLVAGRVLEYRYERTGWEANIGSHGQRIEPPPDFWAIVLSSENPESVDATDPILMIPNERVEGQTLRIADQGKMGRWLEYLDWSSLVAAIHPEWIDPNDPIASAVSPRTVHRSGKRSTTEGRARPEPERRTLSGKRGQLPGRLIRVSPGPPG